MDSTVLCFNTANKLGVLCNTLFGKNLRRPIECTCVDPHKHTHPLCAHMQNAVPTYTELKGYELGMAFSCSLLLWLWSPREANIRALLKVGLANLILKIWEPAKRSHKQEGKTKRTYRGPDHQVRIPRFVPGHVWLTTPDRWLSLGQKLMPSDAGISEDCLSLLSTMEGDLGGHISWLPAAPGRPCSLSPSSPQSSEVFAMTSAAVSWCKGVTWHKPGSRCSPFHSRDNSSRKYVYTWAWFCPLLVMSIAKPRSTSRVWDMRQYDKLPMEAPLRSTQFLPQRALPCHPAP